MDRLTDLVKVLPTFARLRADRSVHAHAALRVRDERLRMALSFHPLFIGGDPFHVTSIYILVSHLERCFGVHYAMGGTGAIAAAMARVIEDQGGEIRLGDGGGRDRCRRRAGCAGCAPPAARRSRRTSSCRTPIRGRPTDGCWAGAAKRWSPERLGRQRWSMGLFVWYFGTRGTRGMWPDVGHHTILNGPRYRELVQDIFVRGKLAEDFSLYLHRPTVTDPSAAPPGDDTFYALSPVPHLGFADAVDWAEAAEPYRQRVAAALEAVLPGLQERVSASLVFTPDDFRDRYLSPHGCGFSIEPRILQSAWFRPHNRSEEVAGLYLVGAGTHPGAGPAGGHRLGGGRGQAGAGCGARRDAGARSGDPARRPRGVPRGDPAGVAVVPRGVAACCRAGCATRRWRSMPSAAWPMTRWTMAAVRRERSRRCMTGSTGSMPGGRGTLRPTGRLLPSWRRMRCRGPCRKPCWRDSRGTLPDGATRRSATSWPIARGSRARLVR